MAVETFDQEGRCLPGYCVTSSDGVLIYRVEAKPSEIRRVEAFVVPEHYRIVMPLPPMPGLPAANRDPANLFTVRVPCLRIAGEYDLRDFIEGCTQLSLLHSPPTSFPPDLFPIAFTNATPADVLAVYGRLLPWGYTFRAPVQTNGIAAEQTALARLRAGASKWFHLR